MKKFLPIILLMLSFSAKSQIWNDVTTSAGFSGTSYYRPTTFDYNNDGYPDMYTTSYSSGVSQGYRFFKNNANSTFSDVTSSLGLSAIDSGLCITTDFNNDGYKDLVYCKNYYSPNLPHILKVYKNNSGQSFTNVTSQLGISNNFFSS